MKKNNFINVLIYTLLGFFLVASIINCSGSPSGSAQVKIPNTLIKEFISKHKTMVDTSLVNFYAQAEQPRIAAMVKKTINEKKKAGVLEKLQNAIFDFSNLNIALAGEKEEYIDDQPTKLIKISVTGEYSMKVGDKQEVIPADETIILEMVGSSWKVTEKVNPWNT